MKATHDQLVKAMWKYMYQHPNTESGYAKELKISWDTFNGFLKKRKPTRTYILLRILHFLETHNIPIEESE